MAKAVGKGLAPYLKALAGSWWLAQFDLHTEAAAAARDAFQIAFSGMKQKEALLFTRTEVLIFLQENLKATPETLGDARKESPEELAERHERVVAASLLAFSSLLDLLVSKQLHDNAIDRDAQSEVVVQLESLLSTQGFFKRVLSSKSTHVRTAAYTLMAHLCYRAPQLLEKHMQAAAPLVLGAFQEQHARAHPNMWEMVLAFVKAYSSAWHAVDMRKAVLPRLLAFLRSGCHGSGSSSYPALLPFLHLLPKGLLGPDSKVANDILEAVWNGCASQPPGKGREAPAAAFTECLCWLLTQAANLAAGQNGAEGYATAVLQGPLCALVVPSALQGNVGMSNTATGIVTDTVRQTRDVSGQLSQLVLSQLGTAMTGVLTSLLCTASSSAAANSFNRFGTLLKALQAEADQKALTKHVAGPVTVALVGPVQQGNAPPEAASLLARVVKQFGGEVLTAAPAAALPGGGRTTGGQDKRALSVQTIISSALAGPQQGPAAQATADLLLSCLQGKPNPAEEFAQTLHHILSLPQEGHQSEHASAEDDVAIITGKFHDVSMGSSGPGAALAVLLVHRLLQTVVQQPSNVLQWRSPALDAVATQLADFGSTTPSQNGATGGTKDDVSAEATALDPAAQKEAAEAADLAASVAAAPLDASERTDAAQETTDGGISKGVLERNVGSPEAITEADSSCAELLGLLVCGKGNSSLLSDPAALQVFSNLKTALASEQSMQGSACLQALHVLQTCLYSEAVSAMSTLHQMRDQVLALVFQLSWPAKRTIKLADSYVRLSSSYDASNDSSDESSDAEGEPEVADGVAGIDESTHGLVAQAALQVWAKGCRAAEVLLDTSVQERIDLEAALQHVLLLHLSKMCAEAFQEPDWHLQAAMLVQEVVAATSPNPPPPNSITILESILAPLNGLQHEQLARTLLAAGLCQVMGFEMVLLGDYPRSAVAAAMLRDAQTQLSLQEAALHLHRFLTSTADSTPGGSTNTQSPKSHLLADTLEHLSTGVTASTSFPDTMSSDIFQTSQTAACMPALVQLLQALTADGSKSSLAVLAQWFKTSIASATDHYPSAVLSQLLPVVVPALRSSETQLLRSGLSELAQQKLAQSARLPPIAALTDGPQDSEQSTSCRQTLDIICSCFPSSAAPVSHSGPAATPGADQPAVAGVATTAAERQALLAAAMRQMQGERSVAVAAAAARRAAEGQETQSSSSAVASATSASKAADAGVARLLLCTVCHCWKNIQPHDWAAMLKHVGSSVSQATVLLEELTEGMAAAAVEGASVVSRGRQGGDVGPSVAVELLWRLRHMGLSDKAEGTKVATDQMGQLLSDEDTLRRVQGAPQASLQTLAAMLALTSAQKPSALQEAAPQEILHDGTRDSLRILFACGTVEAIACATSQSASASCTMWQECSQPMWDAVSAVAVSAAADDSLLAVTSAVQEADAWGHETGVDGTGALLALLLSPNPHQGLQGAALSLLLTPPLLSGVTAASTRADEDASEAPLAKSDPVTALIKAGVRPQLAATICNPPADPPLDPTDPQDVQDLQHFLLAWALLLAHILGMPAGDAGKVFLSQALRTEYEVVPDLLRTILPLLPLEKAAAAKKDRSGAASRAGSAAKQQPQQWDIAATLRQLGVSDDAESIGKLGEAVYRGVLHALPASARAWYGDLRDRGLSAAVEAFTAEQESPLLLQHEFHLIQTAPAAPDMDNFSLKANSITREVIAVMEIEDGAVLEMVIKLPTSSPLRRAEVTCRRRVGVTEGKLRKWLLSVTAFLANQNGSIAEAIALWQRNVQKEFEGVEECLICYSIVSASDGKLPKMHCRTCSKRFHGSCLYKWFQSSGKSNCPHCQSPW
ncbi:TPA: hypothetical protein ACH3X1_000476 [Trebouxia sp. C0004]